MKPQSDPTSTAASTFFYSFDRVRSLLGPLTLACQAAVILVSLIALYMWVPDTLGAWDEETESDFPNFNGAALLVRSGLREHLYEEDVANRAEVIEYCQDDDDDRTPLAIAGPHSACRALDANFRSPPSIFLIYLPLSLLPGDGPYIVSFLVMIAGSLVLAAAPTVFFRTYPAKTAFFLAVLALPILQLAIRLSQPSMLYALAALAGFLLYRRGNRVAAGLVLGVLGFKPQFLLLPIALLCYLRAWKTVGWALGACGVLLLVGFAVIGPEAGGNYFEINIQLLQDGPIALQQAWMYNWEGFLRALTGDAQPLAARLLALVVIVLLVAVWVSRRDLAPSLTVAASVLAVPYVLFYDWVILAAAAALAAAVLTWPGERRLAGLLMILVWAAVWATQDSLPVFGTGTSELPDGTVYWSTLSLALVLALGVFAFRPWSRPAENREVEAPSGLSAK